MMKFTPVRLFVGTLALSAAGYGTVVKHESYVATASIPTKNDRCTVGFGSTYREDGSAVECGETITPPKAIIRSLTHIAKDEAGIKTCVTGELNQKEYDLLVDFTYQYGVIAACNSGMVRHINAGEYAQACEAYGDYKYLKTSKPTPGWDVSKRDANGRPIRWQFDCSKPGNRVCAGVWTRSLERMTQCKAVQ